jgi:predicted ArsR family transcriptional regulator
MSTRQEILTYLENHPFACAEDLSHLLSKTRANIQYHLKQLEKSGCISVVIPPATDVDRGRPRRFYSLATGERPNNLLQLAHALLSAIPSGGSGPDEFLIQVATFILNLPQNTPSGAPRLNRLVKELNQRGYQARWEAHAAGPEIIFRNCPYAALLPGHPELCRMDLKLLENNLKNMSFTQQSRFQLPAVPLCRFVGKS